jgi:hypothetical protein
MYRIGVEVKRLGCEYVGNYAYTEGRARRYKKLQKRTKKKGEDSVRSTVNINVYIAGAPISFPGGGVWF